MYFFIEEYTIDTKNGYYIEKNIVFCVKYQNPAKYAKVEILLGISPQIRFWPKIASQPL